MRFAKSLKIKKVFSSNDVKVFQKRGYADDHHDAHLFKNDIRLSQAYIDKWGFLTPEDYARMEDDIDRDLTEIHLRHQKIREEKIKNWTLEERFPYYTKEELEERNEMIREMKIVFEEAKADRERRAANPEPLPFQPTYENVFGEKSREMLWKRYFRIHGNKAPPEPKSTIRVTAEAPFGLYFILSEI